VNPLEEAFAQNIATAETGLNRYVGDDGKIYTQDDIDAEAALLLNADPNLNADTDWQANPLTNDMTNPFAIAGEADPEGALATISGAALGFPISVGLTLFDLVSLPVFVTKGLITAEQGKTFETVLKELENLPSAQVGSYLKSKVTDLGFSEETAEAFGVGYLGGELSSMIINVIPGLKTLAKSGKYLGKLATDAADPMVNKPITAPGATGTLQEVSKGELEVRPGSADTEAGLPTATFEATEPDFVKFKESGAPVDQLWEHPHVENTTLDMMSRPTTQQQAGEAWTKEMLDAKQPPKKEWQEARELIDPKTGNKIKGWEAAVEYLVDHSKTFAWADDAKWMKANAGKIPENPVKNDRELIIIFGPPAAGKSTLANPIARAKNAAIVDADEAKKMIPGYDDGVGANVVHEESSSLNELVFSATIKEGDNIVLPIVGGRPEKVIEKYIGPAKENGYKVTLVDMMVEPDVAVNRMFGRFVSKKRLIPKQVATVGRGPTETFDALVEQGAADAYTKIDNNPGVGEPRIVIRDDEGLIEAAGIDSRKLDGEGGQRSASDVEPRDASPSPASSEQTQGAEAAVKPRRRTRRKK